MPPSRCSAPFAFAGLPSLPRVLAEAEAKSYAERVGGTEGQYLAAVRRPPADERGRTEGEVGLAVGTEDPARLVAAAREYLQRPARNEPETDIAIIRAAERMLEPDTARKVKAALERARAAREPEDDATGYDGPSQGRTRGIRP